MAKQRTKKHAAKWLVAFATEHQDVEEIKAEMTKRGVTQATISNQIGRLMTHGVIPDTRIETPIVKTEVKTERKISPVPKPSQQPRTKGGRFAKKGAVTA